MTASRGAVGGHHPDQVAVAALDRVSVRVVLVAVIDRVWFGRQPWSGCR